MSGSAAIWLRPKLVLLALALVGSALSTGLLELRIGQTASWRFQFLHWNLFLAWLPAVFGAGLALVARAPGGPLRWPLALPMAVAWLLFLPNAPYLVTDLIHLDRGAGEMPLWFDALLLLSYAGTGLVLGLLSVAVVQDVVTFLLGRTAGWLFAVASLGLAAAGVYLGRFERLNSWDVVARPWSLLSKAVAHLRDPASLGPAWQYTLLMFAMLLGAYLALATLGRRLEEAKQRRGTVENR